MRTVRTITARDQSEESRARRFLEDMEPSPRGCASEGMMEAVDLSAVRSRLNQASQRANKTLTNTEHLVVLVDFIMTKLEGILREIKDLKKTR